MAKVHQVAKAQASKTERRCATCGATILVGEPYKHASIRAGKFAQGRTLVWCKNHYPKPSQLTTSDKKATIYAAIENAEAEINSWGREDVSELSSALTEAADAIREAAEMYRESATNIEDGFGHSTSTSDDLNERADTVEGAADELDSAASNFDEFDEDSVVAEVEEELGTFEAWALDHYGEDVPPAEWDREEYEEAIRDAVSAERDEWAEEQITMASDALSEVEVP